VWQQPGCPYVEETKADWPGALREALTAAAADPDAAAFHLTVRRLVARLEDSHGAVRRDSGAPIPDGAPPLSWDVVEGKVAVTRVDPVEKLRVKVGDVVEDIDGAPAAERVNAAGRLASEATPEHRRYRTCADLRAGPAGRPVALEFRSPSGEAYRLAIPATRPTTPRSAGRPCASRGWSALPGALASRLFPSATAPAPAALRPS
jgi:hypothetical protein